MIYLKFKPIRGVDSNTRTHSIDPEDIIVLATEIKPVHNVFIEGDRYTLIRGWNGTNYYVIETVETLMRDNVVPLSNSGTAPRNFIQGGRV